MYINSNQLFIGDTVTGSYYGVPFTGKIKDMRIVWSEAKERVEVELSSPIDVLQLVRTSITMDLNRSGQGKDMQIDQKI